MTTAQDRIREELQQLLSEGIRIIALEWARGDAEAAEQVAANLAAAGEARDLETVLRAEPFSANYQHWYSRALRVVEQLLPDRLDEFKELYKSPRVVKAEDTTAYGVGDYARGTAVVRTYTGEPVFDTRNVALKKLETQEDILRSAEGRLDFLLSDIAGVLEAGLVDDELEAARELLKAKHIRSAGVIAGVVLERHLKHVIDSRGITFRKKSQIANLNDSLKEAEVYDVPRWRFIQRLGDLRNLCGHDGEREPTDEDAQDLIAGVEKVIAEVF